MISPFKAAIGGDYQRVEARLLRAIHLRFGLPAQLAPDLVKRLKAADREAAYLEATALAGFAVPEARKLFGEPDLPGAVSRPISNRCGRTRRGALSRPLRGTRRERRDLSRAEVSMPRLHVCSLARIDEIVEATGARSMVTLLGPGTAVDAPGAIAPERHLHLEMSRHRRAIPGHVLPGATHIDDLLAFVARAGTAQSRC